MRRLRGGGAALLGVDNTFASPVLTRPLELGAHIVMHSCTKYIGGHSDLLGGALVAGDQELFERLHFVQNATGGVMGPFESFLLSRGLKTLELRVREQSRTAALLAEYLGKHPARVTSELSRIDFSRGTRRRGTADGRRVRGDAIV